MVETAPRDEHRAIKCNRMCSGMNDVDGRKDSDARVVTRSCSTDRRLASVVLIRIAREKRVYGEKVFG